MILITVKKSNFKVVDAISHISAIQWFIVGNSSVNILAVEERPCSAVHEGHVPGD